MHGSESDRQYVHDEALLKGLEKRLRAAADTDKLSFIGMTKQYVNYKDLFRLMTEVEFARCADRIMRYSESTLKATCRRLEELVYVGKQDGKGYHGGHAAFLIEISPVFVVFRGDSHWDREWVGANAVNAAYHFSRSCGSNNDWTRYASGFMIGKLVDPDFGVKELSSNHLEWLTANAGKLANISEELLERKSVDRSMCEQLLSFPAPALIEGVL
jgi:hypothetical protein